MQNHIGLFCSCLVSFHSCGASCQATKSQYAGLDYKAVPRLRECCRHVEAKVVRISRNKVHQTWERPYSPALSNWRERGGGGNGVLKDGRLHYGRLNKKS